MVTKIINWFKNIKSTTGRTQENFLKINTEIDIFNWSFEKIFLANLNQAKIDLFNGNSIQYDFWNFDCWSSFYLYKNKFSEGFSIQYQSHKATSYQELSQNYLYEILPFEIVEFLKKVAHQKTVKQLKFAFNEKRNDIRINFYRFISS